jgi:hypothetical protein
LNTRILSIGMSYIEINSKHILTKIPNIQY